MTTHKVLLIIPAYNEEASIANTLKQIIDSEYDYVIVNDGSTDSTESILQSHNYNFVSLISNLGIGGAKTRSGVVNALAGE